MSKQITVFPQPGYKVRDPQTMQIIPPGGAKVSLTRIIRRRLRDGDLLKQDARTADEKAADEKAADEKAKAITDAAAKVAEKGVKPEDRPGQTDDQPAPVPTLSVRGKGKDKSEKGEH